jgi:hypothetical protein
MVWGVVRVAGLRGGGLLGLGRRQFWNAGSQRDHRLHGRDGNSGGSAASIVRGYAGGREYRRHARGLADTSEHA